MQTDRALPAAESLDVRVPPAGTRFTSGYRNALLGLLLLTMILNILDRQVVNILAEPIRKDLNLTDTQLGLITGLAFAVVYNIVALPLGRYADKTRSNRVTIMSISLAVWSGMTALCGAAQTFSHLLLTRIGVAAGEAGCQPPAHSLIAETFPPHRRARALAIFGLGIPIGAFLGKALGGELADTFGWRAAFLIVGLPGIALAVVLSLFLREPRRAALQAAKPAAPSIPLWDVLTEVSKSKAFVNLALAVATAMLLVTGGSVWGAIHFQRNLGVSTGETGFWLGISGGVAGVIGTWAGGWFADRYGSRNPRHYMTAPIVGMLLAAPLLFFGWWSHSWVIALALIFLPDMFDNLYYGGAFAAIQGLVEESMRATATASFLFFSTMIGAGLGSLSFGFVSDLLKPLVGENESVRYVLMGAAILYVIPAFFFWRASRFVAAELKERAARAS